ncbi:MAG: hypothetical protein Q9184_005645 [Pyrenodesmia sp. 2 TL-2023]
MASSEHSGHSENEDLTLEMLKEMPYLTADAELEHDEEILALLEKLPYLTADAEVGLHPTLQRIQNLPPDLLNMVMARLWEGAFCPGYIYLPAHIDYKKLRRQATDSRAAKPTLLALSKGVLADYERRFWMENTFVIGVGEPLDIDESGFMGWLPDKASEYVKKVYVTFSTRDLGPFYTSSLRREHPCWRPAPWDQVTKKQPTTRKLDISDAERGWNERQMNELQKIWIGKKWALHELRLEELTLDFLECYSTDGYWIGDEVAETMAPFPHGLPRSLEIIAPDEAMRAKIEGIVRQGYQ